MKYSYILISISVPSWFSLSYMGGTNSAVTLRYLWGVRIPQEALVLANRDFNKQVGQGVGTVPRKTFFCERNSKFTGSLMN